MNLPEATGRVLRRYAVFRGRAERSEFWWWVLAVTIGQVILGIVGGAIGFPLLGIVFSLAVLLPSLAVTTRRLHDTGRKGSWLVIWIVIYIILGGIMLIGFSLMLVGGLAGLAGEESFEDLLLGGAVGVYAPVLPMLAVAIWSTVWLARKGEDGDNRFGPDPRAFSGS